MLGHERDAQAVPPGGGGFRLASPALGLLSLGPRLVKGRGRCPGEGHLHRQLRLAWSPPWRQDVGAGQLGGAGRAGRALVWQAGQRMSGMLCSQQGMIICLRRCCQERATPSACS